MDEEAIWWLSVDLEILKMFNSQTVKTYRHRLSRGASSKTGLCSYRERWAGLPTFRGFAQTFPQKRKVSVATDIYRHRLSRRASSKTTLCTHAAFKFNRWLQIVQTGHKQKIPRVAVVVLFGLVIRVSLRYKVCARVRPEPFLAAKPRRN